MAGPKSSLEVALAFVPEKDPEAIASLALWKGFSWTWIVRFYMLAVDYFDHFRDL